MATFNWATHGPQSARFPAGASEKGGTGTVAALAEAASQTFVKGDPLVLVSDLLTKASVGAVTSATLFVGFANQDASGTTNTMREYIKPSPDAVYALPCYSGASAAATGLGMTKDLFPAYFVSDGVGLVVDTSSNTNPVFQVVGFVTGETPWGTMAVGDTGGLLLVKFLTATPAGQAVI